MKYYFGKNLEHLILNIIWKQKRTLTIIELHTFFKLYNGRKTSILKTVEIY